MYERYAVLFALIFTGYFLKKIKFIDDSMYKWLNQFIIYFAYPCLIVHNIGTLEISMKLFWEFISAIVISCAFFAVYSVFAFFYTRVRKYPRELSNTAEMAMVSPNNGFMGLPIALIFLGEKGLFFMLAHNVTLNLYFFTYGTSLMDRNKEHHYKRSFRVFMKGLIKVVLNPNILGVIIGLLICMFKMPLADSPFDEYLTFIGNVSTPMSMLFIGSTLAGKNALDIIKNHIVLEASVIKLIVFPLLTFVIVYFLPVSVLIKETVILGACFPCATTVVMLAQHQNQNSSLASDILFLSTVASMGTIPLAMTAMNLMF